MSTLTLDPRWKRDAPVVVFEGGTRVTLEPTGEDLSLGLPPDPPLQSSDIFDLSAPFTLYAEAQL